MKGARTKEKTLKIWEAYRQGHNSKEVAEMMGLSRCAVRTALTRGRKNGSIPPLKRASNLKHLLRAGNLRNGHISEVFENLTIEQTRWLINEASKVEAETVSEYLVELVRDEYERERERDNG
jgi:transposase